MTTDSSHDRSPATDELMRRLADVARADRLTEEIAGEHEERGTFDAAFRSDVARAVRSDSVRAGIARETSAREPSAPAAVGQDRPGVPHWLPLAAALLIACGIAFLAAPWSRPGDPPTTTEVDLPAFTLEAQSVDELRGPGDPRTTDQTIVVVPGLRFRIVLRPSWPPSRPIDAGVFVGHDGGSVVPWTAAQARLAVGEHGVVRLEDLPIEAWRELPGGELTLLFAVGPADALPDAAELERLLERAPTSAGTRSWRLARQPIRVESPDAVLER